jgi:hypothetical protein
MKEACLTGRLEGDAIGILFLGLNVFDMLDGPR